MSAQRSKEFYELIRNIGETRSKSEEDKIIGREITRLKNHFRLGQKVTERRKKELIVRVLYCELLGHEATFGHIEAIKLTSSKNVLHRRVGYLAVTLLLPPENELVLLTVANLQKDLECTNQLQVNSALTTATKIVSKEKIPSLAPLVRPLLDRPFPLVRKKAIVFFRTVYNIDEDSVPDILAICKRGLSDRNPSVMAATLDLFIDMYKKAEDKEPLKGLAHCFVQILDQVVERQLPTEYLYRRIPAPWVQIKLLRILASLGKNDQEMSRKFYPVIKKCLKKNDIGLTIGFAVVYECVRTITSIYAQKTLLQLSLSSVNRLLASTNHNLKCIGMYCLKRITKLQPTYARHYFNDMMECLEDSDDFLRKVTLQVLCQFTNPTNISAIIPRLFSYVRRTVNETEKKELIQRIIVLSETHAPNVEMHLSNIQKLYEISPEYVPKETLTSVVRMLREEEMSDTEEMRGNIIPKCIKEFIGILESGKHVSPDFIRLICWFLSEYHPYAKPYTREEILDIYCDTIDLPMRGRATRGMILFCLLKIILTGNENNFSEETEEIRSTIEKFCTAVDMQTQQVSREIMYLTSESGRARTVIPQVIPEVGGGDLEMDEDLTFLDWYVDKALEDGASDYQTQHSVTQGLDGDKATLVTEHRGGHTPFMSRSFGSKKSLSFHSDAGMIRGLGEEDSDDNQMTVLPEDSENRDEDLENGIVSQNLTQSSGMWGDHIEQETPYEEEYSGDGGGGQESQTGQYEGQGEEDYGDNEGLRDQGGIPQQEGGIVKRNFSLRGVGRGDWVPQPSSPQNRGRTGPSPEERAYEDRKRRRAARRAGKKKKGRKKNRDFVGSMLSGVNQNAASPRRKRTASTERRSAPRNEEVVRQEEPEEKKENVKEQNLLEFF